MASYPTSVYSATTKNPGDSIQSASINNLDAEIAAIESALTGGSGLAHDLKFVDALYDIGKSGATRPRDFFLSRNATIGGTLTVTGIATFSAAAQGINGAATAGNVTYSFTNDTDTGMFRAGVNALALGTGGTQRIQIDDGGVTGAGLFFVGSLPTSGAAANCVVANNDYLRLSTSSIRFKHDIASVPLAQATAWLLALPAPITYRSKTDTDQRQWIGLSAEDVSAAVPLLATYDGGGLEGIPNYVTYDRVAALLVPVVQDHEARLAALERKPKPTRKKA
jgi:hypothetical protein